MKAAAMRVNALRSYRIGGLLALLLFALAFPVLFANPTGYAPSYLYLPITVR